MVQSCVELTNKKRDGVIEKMMTEEQALRTLNRYKKLALATNKPTITGTYFDFIETEYMSWFMRQDREVQIRTMRSLISIPEQFGFDGIANIEDGPFSDRGMKAFFDWLDSESDTKEPFRYLNHMIHTALGLWIMDFGASDMNMFPVCVNVILTAFEMYCQANRPAFRLSDDVREMMIGTDTNAALSDLFEMPAPAFPIVFETPIVWDDLPFGCLIVSFSSKIANREGDTDLFHPSVNEKRNSEDWTIAVHAIPYPYPKFWQPDGTVTPYGGAEFLAPSYLHFTFNEFKSGDPARVLADGDQCLAEMYRIVFNTLMYINSAGAELDRNVRQLEDLESKKALAKSCSSRKEHARLVNDVKDMYKHSVIEVGRKIGRTFRRVREATKGHVARHFVRGHYRKIEKRAEPVWVRPHFRGNRAAGEVASKDYKLKV